MRMRYALKNLSACHIVAANEIYAFMPDRERKRESGRGVSSNAMIHVNVHQTRLLAVNSIVGHVHVVARIAALRSICN